MPNRGKEKQGRVEHSSGADKGHEAQNVIDMRMSMSPPRSYGRISLAYKGGRVDAYSIKIFNSAR